MGNYQVSRVPVDQLTELQLRGEARELRQNLTGIEAELSRLRSWAAADKRETDVEYLTKLAKARHLHGVMQTRYALIRPVEKDLNRRTKHGHLSIQ